ncbi:TonB-dependent receptor [Aliidiomarina halalkaliphila]|nr:TonB-dependent receptor [Aliidiomarina halalkaliphila]
MTISKVSSAVCTALALSTFVPFALNAQESTEQHSEQSTTSIERILIIGDFRARGVEDVAGSVSVLQGEDLRAREADHLENALIMAPNVNLASGASRGSFFQIRGIGERSQFVDPINPSVGLMIDGINYSGIGSAGTLFDIGQVEVFRGPQSTRYGADAMAGVIYLGSEPVEFMTSGQVEALWANYNTYAAGVALQHGFSDQFAMRGSLYSFVSDGFQENIFLDRNDTQNKDELTLRLNSTWLVSDDLTLDFTYHRFDIDNGYDAWSLDGNRQTLSDTPGRDTLDSHAGRIAANYSGNDGYVVQLMTSALWAKSEYSYDEDWAFEGIRPGWEYNSFDAYFRDREQVELEGRVLSDRPIDLFGLETEWLYGVYYQTRRQDLDREYTYLSAPFASRYDSDRTAAYAELQQQLSERLQLTYGLRWERYANDYADTRGITAEPTDSAWGGRLSLEYAVAPMRQLYATATRGFKAGGVNGEALGRVEDRNLEDHREFLESRATFAPEYLTSVELGYKAFLPEHSLQFQVNAFYSWRDDMQVNAYVERDGVFVTYMDNASDGTNYGVEASVNYVPTDWVRWFASVGLLETQFNDLVLRDGTNLRGRSQAHAPRYQAHVGGDFELGGGFTLRVEMDARDRFYYSNTHDQESSPYQLLHARLTYRVSDWELSLWARNILDEDYTTRGFFFGNDPRKDYAPETYVQWGEPRRIGLTARYRF